MRNDIRPIPTLYNGITYRSRMEARWSCFFTLGGIDVRYEFEGFQTSAGWYLPDFEFKDTETPTYFEVKPEVPTTEEWAKMKALAKKADVFVAIGAPEANYFVWKVLPDFWQEQWYFVSDYDGFASYMRNGFGDNYVKVRVDPAPISPATLSDIEDLMEKAERHQFDIYDDARRREVQSGVQSLEEVTQKVEDMLRKAKLNEARARRASR
jgi:hypothetical protein